jgi:hypothetical protein
MAIINTISAKGKAEILGSMGVRSQQYSGDYDLFETVKISSASEFAKRLQQIVDGLSDMRNVFIGDIKCGLVKEWSVVPDSERSYNVAQSEKKLDELREAKIIAEDEYLEAKDLLKKEDYTTVKKEIKFDVVRWTPKEIKVGFVILRNGKRLTLGDAIKSGGLTKLDCVGWVNSKYVEFSIIYDIILNGKRLFKSGDVKESLLRDMKYYRTHDEPFKYVKRTFALAKATKNAKLGNKMIKIINSDLGRLYLLSSDIAVLLYLLENNHTLNKDRLDTELANLRSRMGNVYDIPAFLLSEPRYLETLYKIERSEFNSKDIMKELTVMKEAIDKQLADATRLMLRGG